MSVRATCDACFVDYTVPDSRAGQSFKCKSCGGTVRVPRAGQSESRQSAPPPAPRARPQNAPAKKKRKPSGSGGRPLLIAALVLIAVTAVGIGGYLLLPAIRSALPVGSAGAEPETAASSTGSSAVGGGAAPQPGITGDERTIVADFQKMTLGLGNASGEQRMAALQKFAADRNLKPEDVLAILQKDQANQEAANRVAVKWTPLTRSDQVGGVWPTEASISIPSDYGAVMTLPAAQTPYLLVSTSGAQGTERRAFDLTTSGEMWHTTSPLVATHNDQLSANGNYACVQDGFRAPIRLHILNGDNDSRQEVTSPDLLNVVHMACLASDELLVLTPRSPEGTPDRTLRCLVLNTMTGKETSRFEREFHFAGSEQISVSRGGRYLLVVGKGKSIEVIEIATGEQLCALDLKNEGFQFGQLHSVAFSYDASQIAVLEQQPLVGLRLYIIDSATGDITLKTDLYGGMTCLGAPAEMTLEDPLVWFPDERHILIGKLLAVDTTTGRRVWQAQGEQSSSYGARFPTTSGLLYQVNTEGRSDLVTLPIDFERIAATQAGWPSDAVLAPGMNVSVAVDLSGSNLQEVNDVIKAGMQAALERNGFAVGEGSDRVLTISLENGSVAFRWMIAGEVVWESVAVADTAMVPQIGHLRGNPAERALNMEGVVKLQAYPVPYFIAADRQWTMPVIDQINHGN